MRKGRREEFTTFAWKGEPPDPQSGETFLSSKLHWECRTTGQHAVMLALFTRLIQLRTDIPALAHLDNKSIHLKSFEDLKVLVIRRWHEQSHICMIFNFAPSVRRIQIDIPEGRWLKMFDSSQKLWGGSAPSLQDELVTKDELTLQPFAASVYVKEG